MKKLENFKKGIQTLNKEEVNTLKGGNSPEVWQWVWFEPTWSWMWMKTSGI